MMWPLLALLCLQIPGEVTVRLRGEGLEQSNQGLGVVALFLAGPDLAQAEDFPEYDVVVPWLGCPLGDDSRTTVDVPEGADTLVTVVLGRGSPWHQESVVGRVFHLQGNEESDLVVQLPPLATLFFPVRVIDRETGQPVSAQVGRRKELIPIGGGSGGRFPGGKKGVTTSWKAPPPAPWKGWWRGAGILEAERDGTFMVAADRGSADVVVSAHGRAPRFLGFALEVGETEPREHLIELERTATVRIISESASTDGIGVVAVVTQALLFGEPWRRWDATWFQELDEGAVQFDYLPVGIEFDFHWAHRDGRRGAKILSGTLQPGTTIELPDTPDLTPAPEVDNDEERRGDRRVLIGMAVDAQTGYLLPTGLTYHSDTRGVWPSCTTGPTMPSGRWLVGSGFFYSGYDDVESIDVHCPGWSQVTWTPPAIEESTEGGVYLIELEREP